MMFKKERPADGPPAAGQGATPAAVAEQILEEKLEYIATLLCKSETDRSRLYEEILAMVERGLVRIALRRNNRVKSAAAVYLGINRNTFQKKMVKLGIEPDGE